MKIKRIVLITEITLMLSKELWRCVPKESAFKVCIDGIIINVFLQGELQQETVYSYCLRVPMQMSQSSNLASNWTWKLRIIHVGVVNARESLEKRKNQQNPTQKKISWHYAEKNCGWVYIYRLYFKIKCLECMCSIFWFPF